MLLVFIKKIALSGVVLFALYLLVGQLFHRVIFPEKKPEIATWFQPGQLFYSKAEGVRQTVLSHQNGMVHCRSEIEPFAPGPPKHIHNDFDEVFQVENGELSIWVNGEVEKIRAGDVLHIPKGTPHKPYNETADTIHIKGSIAFPEKFAFYLAQIYGIMDSDPDFEKRPDIPFQMAMFQSSGFDSYLAEGPPVFIQQTMGFVLTPMLRALGYRSYYEKYDVQLINQR